MYFKYVFQLLVFQLLHNTVDKQKNSSEGGKVSATGSPPTAVSCAEGVDDIGRVRGRTALPLLSVLRPTIF